MGIEATCPNCGRQLHRVPEEDDRGRNLLKCFNGPEYWTERDGELVNVSVYVNLCE